MSTAGVIIGEAFREGNFIPVGDAATATQIAEALPRLNALVETLFGNEMGGLLRDWYTPSSWSVAQETRHPLTPLTEDESTSPFAYVPENSRIIASIGSARTLYLPGSPRDGARMAVNDVGSAATTLTLNGNGRLIEGVTSIADTPANFHGDEWLYRADLSNWILLADITAEANELPLPNEFDDLFVTGLCMRLAERYGADLRPSVSERHTDMVARFVKRYHPDSRLPSATELRAILRTTE